MPDGSMAQVDVDQGSGMDPTSSNGDARPMSALAGLIKDKNDGGYSYARMERNALRQGFSISSQYLNKIANGKVRRPEAEKLPAIAAALGVREATVREAAARSAGVHVEHDVDFKTSELLNSVSEMSRAQRDRWLRLSRAIAEVLAIEEELGPRTVIAFEGEEPSDLGAQRANHELSQFDATIKDQERKRRRGPGRT